MAACQAAGIPAALHRLARETPTVETAAEALGTEVARIVKTLVFETKGGLVVLAIAAGTARVDSKRVAAAAGLEGAAGRLRMVPGERCVAAVGYPAGGVAPLFHEPRPHAVVVDAGIPPLGRVFGGGGAIDAMLEVDAADIVRGTGARVASIQ